MCCSQNHNRKLRKSLASVGRQERELIGLRGQFTGPNGNPGSACVIGTYKRRIRLLSSYIGRPTSSIIPRYHKNRHAFYPFVRDDLQILVSRWRLLKFKLSYSFQSVFIHVRRMNYGVILLSPGFLFSYHLSYCLRGARPRIAKNTAFNNSIRILYYVRSPVLYVFQFPRHICRS